MKNIIKKFIQMIEVVGFSLSFLVGCSVSNNNNAKIDEEVVTNIIQASNPNTSVHIGPFESSLTGELTELDEATKTYGSSTILDMPKNAAINVVYDNENNMSLQSVACFLGNIVEANDEVQIISVKDRGGNHKRNLLSTDGEKIQISSAGGFEYGEVYQIEINDAPYLAFEGKDPQIRKLTIEIEDDPSESDTYDIKDLKDNIVKLDLENVENKKQDKGQKTYSFDYKGELPAINVGQVFYVTSDGESDYRRDFYGTFVNKSLKNGITTVTYTEPDMHQIYDDFKMKGKEDVDLTNAEILLTSEFALQEFKRSAIARGLTHTLLDITVQDIETILNILNHLNIGINIDVVGSRVHFKISVTLNSLKLKDNHYIAIEIGRESVTDYIMDFDLSLSYSWIFPTGLDYKVKCIEETQDSWYFRLVYDHQPISDIKESDTDYTNKLLDDIEKSLNGESSKGGEILDPNNTSPSTSGTKTTFPLISFDIHYFTPLQIKFKLDFYFDMGFQALGLIKYESRSTNVLFNFSNMDGGSQDTKCETSDTSNIGAYIAGSFHIEIGLRVSLGISILGLYDYLRVEGYAEAYLNLSVKGLLAMNVDLTNDEFSGYYSIDLAFIFGVRAGLNVKCVVTSFGLNYNFSWYLFRLKFDNPLEHWGEHAETSIEMKKETMSLDETGVLWAKYFDPLTFSIKEQQYKANAQFQILDGILVENALKRLSKGHMFEYTSLDPTLLEINEDGVIHVKDGTPSEFTAHIKIHVPGVVGFIEDRTVTIHYTASDIKDLYYGDNLIGQYRPQYSIKLPEPEKIRGKEFEYYKYKDKIYKVGDTFVMPNESAVLETHYRDLSLYKVYFYDGYDILVAMDEVYEGEDAHEPIPVIRDRYMDDGWAFFYWDRSFKNVHKELHVVGCYFRIG